MSDILKLCSVCKVQKPKSEFGPELRRKSKLKYLCRECDTERQRIRYFNPKDPAVENERRRKHSEYVKARFAAKKERGECLFCTNQAAKPSTQCEQHLAAAREREANRRKRLAVTGVCTRCGQHPQAPSMLMCVGCLKTQETRNRTRRWKYAPAGYSKSSAARELEKKWD